MVFAGAPLSCSRSFRCGKGMEEALGIKMGETTQDGLFTLEYTDVWEFVTSLRHHD